MIISKMSKLFLNSFFLILLIISPSFANDDFNEWIKDFKVKAISYGVSEKIITEIMSEAKFLPKVIEYDRYQPEFYEEYIYIY